MKYRATIVYETTVDADTKAEAEQAAFEKMEAGAGVFGCEVEPLERGRDEE